MNERQQREIQSSQDLGISATPDQVVVARRAAADPNIRGAEQQYRRRDLVTEAYSGVSNIPIKAIERLEKYVLAQRQQVAQAARREILNDFTDWTELPIIKRDCDQVTLRILQIAINKRLAALGDVVGEQR